jgi:hypothetical protein
MDAVRNSSIFRKILLSVVVASMLSLHLASIVKDATVTANADAIAEISSMVNDNGSTEDCLAKTETELSFNVDLAPAEELRLPDDRLLSLVKPAPAVLPLEETLSEIFTPPETAS